MALPEPKLDEFGHWEVYRDHQNKFIKKIWCSDNSFTSMKLKSPTDFITPNKDVVNGDTIEFLDEGVYNILPQDSNKEVLTFWVKVPSGERKKISINATSQIELEKAWTNESSKWVGKEAVVKIVSQRVFNKDKEVIYLSPAEGKVAPLIPEDIPDEEIPITEDEN